MTIDDPNVRRTLAKLKWRFREMRREGQLVLQGKKRFTDAASTDVLNTFRRYDFVPPSQLRETA